MFELLMLTTFTRHTFTRPTLTIITILCRYVVGIVFGFEHLLLVAAVVLQWSVNPVPKWVRVAIARREYLATKRAVAAAERSSSPPHMQEKRREE